jgi:hypothetical protein
MAQKAPVRVSWKTEEYVHREKGPDWFWALGVIAIAGAVLAVVYHDILFAVLIVVSAVILGYYAARRPEVIEVAISDDGIMVRDYLYPFASIKSFNVDQHPEGTRLMIESDRLLVPIFSVPVPQAIDAESLTEYLREKIPEKPLHEKHVHRIMERLGF